MSITEQKDAIKDRQIDRNEKADESLSSQIGAWFRKKCLLVINLVLSVYLILPVMAPVLMKTGASGAADLIYRIYKPLCHQLAYRSFFLFGEQSVYPRELAKIDGLKSFEEATGLDPEDQQAAMAFRGNETLGFKIALCQRDVAIYGSLLLFGLVFGLSKRKIKPLPWLLWILLALGPIGLDGFSQLLSQFDQLTLEWLLPRESTPLLRVLTGAMFGWFTAWFGIPSIEEMVNPPAKLIKTPLKEDKYD
jgi:uncharacterized membrane protein